MDLQLPGKILVHGKSSINVKQQQNICCDKTCNPDNSMEKDQWMSFSVLKRCFHLKANEKEKENKGRPETNIKTLNNAANIFPFLYF